MKRKVLRRLLVGDVLICSLLLAGVAVLTGHDRSIAEETRQTPAAAPQAAQTAPVTVTLTTDKPAYHRGERVNFTITAHNNTAKPQTLQFFSGQWFEIAARPVGGKPDEPAWVWSRGKLFTMDMPTRTVAAGASATWTASWDQTNNSGTTVPRGQYQVDSHLATTPILAAAPVTVNLTD